MATKLPRLGSWIIALGVLYTAFWGHRYYEDVKHALLGDMNVRRCEPAQYNTRIVSYSPLIVHLENFISPVERKHLAGLASTRFNRSRIGTEGKESPLRDSFSAYLPSSDHTVQCLVERAAEFQGFAPLDHFEVVQVVKYHNKQRFDAHYDWRGNLTRDRHTSFFALLEANCSNCGTQFPRVRFDDQTNRGHADERWCRLVNCTADELIFLPQPGNAIFWRNLDDDGAGDKRTLHSGLPVDNEHGTKIGLNIWTNTRSGKERKRDETKKSI